MKSEEPEMRYRAKTMIKPLTVTLALHSYSPASQWVRLAALAGAVLTWSVLLYLAQRLTLH